MRFGDLLRTLRLAAGVKQEGLAAALDVAPNYISGIELGHSRPFSVAQCRAVATELGCDLLPLLQAAGVERGVFRLPAMAHDDARNATAARLVLTWESLSAAQLASIDTVIAQPAES